MAWFKNKIRNWLFKEDLELLNSLYEIKLEMDQAILHAKHSEKNWEDSYNLNKQIKELVTPLLDIGTDIGFYKDHSWAVICIKGKPEYVKFISLEHKDTQEIINFLKHFDKSNNVIDSPLAFKNILNKEMFI